MRAVTVLWIPIIRSFACVKEVMKEAAFLANRSVLEIPCAGATLVAVVVT